MGPVQSVSAFTGTLGHERIEVEDVAVAALRFKNGAFGAIEGSTAIYPGFMKKIEICGTRGSVVLEEDSLKTWSFAEQRAEDMALWKSWWQRTKSGGGAADPAAISFLGHQRQFEDFVEALETDRDPFVYGVEARKSGRNYSGNLSECARRPSN
jgi:predicted dehydrogenase